MNGKLAVCMVVVAVSALGLWHGIGLRPTPQSPQPVKQDYWFSTQTSGNEVMVTFCSGSASSPDTAWCHLVGGGGNGGLRGAHPD